MTTLRGKALDQLTWADIEALVSDQAEEGQFLEFKQTTDPRGKNLLLHDSGEFFSKVAGEVCAFSNSGGGTVVLGIAESEDKPARAASIEKVEQLHSAADRLARSIVDLLSPKPKIVVQPVVYSEADGTGVIVIGVSESSRKPVAVGQNTAKLRLLTESKQMSVEQIRQMSLETERGLAYVEKILSDHIESQRLIGMQDGQHRILLSVVPLRSLDPGPLDSQIQNFLSGNQVLFQHPHFGNRSFNSYGPSTWRPSLGGIKSEDHHRFYVKVSTVREIKRWGLCTSTINHLRPQDSGQDTVSNIRADMMLAESWLLISNYLRLAKLSPERSSDAVLQCVIQGTGGHIVKIGDEPLSPTKVSFGQHAYPHMPFSTLGGAIEAFRDLQRSTWNLAGREFSENSDFFKPIGQ